MSSSPGALVGSVRWIIRAVRVRNAATSRGPAWPPGSSPEVDRHPSKGFSSIDQLCCRAGKRERAALVRDAMSGEVSWIRGKNGRQSTPLSSSYSHGSPVRYLGQEAASMDLCPLSSVRSRLSHAPDELLGGEAPARTVSGTRRNHLSSIG